MFTTTVIKVNFFVLMSMFLAACGGGVVDHFSQGAPETPVIDIAADDKNKWLVSLQTATGAQQVELYWADNQSLDNAKKILLDNANAPIDVKKLLDNSVAPGETIYISVVGTWEGKSSGESNIVEYVVQPNEPTGFTKVSLTGNSEIKWTKAAIDDETLTYNIYWSTDPSVSGVDGNYQGSSLNLAIPNFLHDLSEYPNLSKVYYVIYSEQAGVESVVSNTIEVVVRSTATLDTPIEFQATVNGKQIDLTWTAVDGAESYRIFRNTIKTFTAVSVFTQTSTTESFSDSLLLSSTDYYYWVMAVGSGGSSELSLPIGPYQIFGLGNIPPSFSTDINILAPENSTDPFVTILAIDPQDTVVTYALEDDNDKAIFELDGLLGTLKFNFPHNFESESTTPYQVEISATSQGQTQQKTFLINVADVNEPPIFNVKPSYPVAENTLAVATIDALDPEAISITYSIKDGVDGALFEINANTGALRFSTGNSPNYEDPIRTNNLYNIFVIATDGVFSVDAAVQIAVTPVNEPPIIGENANFNAQEKTQDIRRINAADPDAGQTLIFSITGGADADKFTIDSSNGLLRFKIPLPVFETPNDTGNNGVYEVQISVADAKFTVSKDFSIKLAEVNEPPSFTMGVGPFFVEENKKQVVLLTATDPDLGDQNNLSFSILDIGSPFRIINGNELEFISAPDFEIGNTVFSVNIRLDDKLNTVDQEFVVNITDVNEPPIFSQIANPFSEINEATIRDVGNITAIDPEGEMVTYSLKTNTLDNELFGIAPNLNSGFITFVTSPDYEQALDSDGNNIYQIEVTATDQSNNSSTQTVSIKVLPVNEAPYFTTDSTPTINEELAGVFLTIAAEDPEQQTVNIILSGGLDSAQFNFDPDTNKLTFNEIPDYENPKDVGGDNTYDIIFSANDSLNLASLAMKITIQNTNDNKPYFVTSPALSMPENDNSIISRIDVQDDDNLSPLSVYVLAGGGDDGDFIFDAATRELKFNVSKDYEIPTDNNLDNDYQITLRVTDGDIGNDVDQSFIVSVSDVVNALTKPTLNVVPSTKIKTTTPFSPYEKYFLIKRPTDVINALDYFLYFAQEPNITPGNYRSKLSGQKMSIGINAAFKSSLISGVDKTFYFILTAGDGSEESVFSDEVTATTYTPSLVLNDTGIVKCATNDLGDLNCNSPADTTDLFTPQDAENGRDRAKLLGNLNKIGGGQAAFDFDKINLNGSVVQPGDLNWSCVRDNVTGLTWEVKTSTAGLHASAHTFTWFNTDNSANAGGQGSISGGTCYVAGQCDTQKFVNSVNSGTGFCGSKNWRLPTVDELASIIDYNIAPPDPVIDGTYFDQYLTPKAYWTSVPLASSAVIGADVWVMFFNDGKTQTRSKASTHHIRLVHD